jgi:hypothetical protein
VECTNILQDEPFSVKICKLNLSFIFKERKHFGLGVNLDKCVVMKISQEPGSVEKVKCNNEVK